MSTPMHVAMPEDSAPVLFEGDVVVIGGSFAGVATALALARAGRSVALAERRTYLGQESTATLRHWLTLPESGHLPPPLVTFSAAISARRGAQTPFAPDALKLHLEDRLLAAGVKLLYASSPLSIAVSDGSVAAVVVANKSGRQALRAGVVVVADLIGAHVQPPRTLSRVIEFDRVADLPWPRLRVPGHLGVVGDQVTFHEGHAGRRHVLVEILLDARRVMAAAAARAPGAADAGAVIWSQGKITDPTLASRAELAARAAGMAVAMHLMSTVEQFEGAYLAGVSHETAGLAQHLATPDWSRAGHRGLYRVEPERTFGADGLPGAAASCRAGEEVAERILREDDAGLVGSPPLAGARPNRSVATDRGSEELPAVRERATHRAAASTESSLRVALAPPSGRYAGRSRLTVAAMRLPIAVKSDVLVVGGGSSGATAATVAAGEGLSVVLVDMNPGLGGTGTYGGVNDYWFGRRVGFAGRLSAQVDAMHECLRHDVPATEVPVWNIEAKAHVLADGATRAGVISLLNAVAFGAVVEAGDREGDEVRVSGVAVATALGPVALLADAVIDATGDGDVAAWAGAPTVYGSSKDHVTMWYSLAQFGMPGRTRNNFTSTVDVGDVEDYTRAILAGRRRKRGDKELHDHGVYLAPRESRHVLGEVVLTLSDQLLRRGWPDTVNVAFSNNDVKGHTTSDWVRCGLISPNLEVEVPYRALLPRGVRGLLVVGKAISATHDALPAIRMQADLENLGGAAALAAAQSLKTGVDLTDIDVRALQERLVAEGALPSWVTGTRLAPWRPDVRRLEDLVYRLPFDEPLYSYSDMAIGQVFEGRIPFVDLTCAGPDVVPVLERQHREEIDPGRKLRLAQALAMVGSRAGVSTLVEAILSQLEREVLPPRARLRHAVAPPDQGAMPDVVYLVHALGLTRDERAIEVWERITQLLDGVTRADFRDASKDMFDYVDAVCVGAERLGSRRAVPVLERLHALEPFSGQVSTEPFQADYFDERQAYLEIVIGRALARCGSASGLQVLVSYLSDSRALLARHARSELSRLVGEEVAGAPDEVRLMVERLQGELEPRPDLEPSDARRMWDEPVLVRA